MNSTGLVVSEPFHLLLGSGVVLTVIIFQIGFARHCSHGAGCVCLPKLLLFASQCVIRSQTMKLPQQAITIHC